MTEWAPDTELDGFEQWVFPLPEEPTYALEPEKSLVATLVRAGEPSSTRALLYVHGWNDYFFQRHLADEVTALCYDFYALDLRRYGRSLRPKQLAGYIAQLSDYFVELDLAVERIRAEGHEHVVLMGHSTGGLVSSLYAHERPGTFDALVLNSPWLEMQGNAILRPATQPVFSAVRAVAPTTALPAVEVGHYQRAIHASLDGEWDFNVNLKGDPAFLLRIGWLAAIMEGHAQVSAGLEIDCPILVGVSERSDFRRKWDEALTKADIVLDVDRIVERAAGLGRLVVIARFTDAMHDLVLSAPDVRSQVFAEYARFIRCYADDRPVSTL
ncbi:MAG: alpha/beta hydrolase [Arachnia sp.]